MYSILPIFIVFGGYEPINAQYLPPFNTCPAAKFIENIRHLYLKKYWEIAVLKILYEEKQIQAEKDRVTLQMEMNSTVEQLQRRNDRLYGLVDQTKVNVRDCMWYMIEDIDAKSGVYNLSVNGVNVTAYCDMETASGGWTTIFARDETKTNNFTRSWIDYKIGFGSVPENYWIGNAIMHELTKDRPSEVYFKLTDDKNITKWAKYQNFTIGPEEEQFILNVNDTSYEGTAGDALIYGKHNAWSVNGMAFSTYDMDNDRHKKYKCAADGGWWMNKCGVSPLTLTAMWWVESRRSVHVKPRDDLKKVAMMIRF
ncbi:hypothetical protein FSP39_017384 [Pinctada imbricata]|uniref:Fibrinogen C-terminal domain-containing protein n=1 Tax=Pinctada imbricata TaxID=66713 RepID=A0AA88XLD6_PINIB|nr:hypothetical protein FSP39_017384 [Pinctada imbricata]